ncbi:DNA sulphur modification protein DndB [Acidimicrobiia bacterium]
MSENPVVNIPPPLADNPTTPAFDFLYGAYNLNEWCVPYLTTTLQIPDAAKYLRLPSELPGSEEIDWKVDELYQRDIDWARVQTGLVQNYLSSKDHPHFFNSITIAILPFDDTTNTRRENFGDAYSWNAPEMLALEGYKDTLRIGPIHLGFFQEDVNPGDSGFNLGRVRWNPEQVFGVAIDGQHRLAALKLLDKQGIPPAVLKKTRVPVIFLVFDERLGFVNPEGRSVVEMLRALFIDLNKHAKTVSRARQILLDDRDAHAVCVRRLLGTGISPGLEELKQVPPRLPLSLIDWHSEQAKFESGPYLTTILGLDWIVSEVLGKSPRDFMSYSSLRTYMKGLKRILGVDLDVALDRLEEIAKFGYAPFAFEPIELEAIATAFGNAWSPGLVHVFTHLQPYSNVVAVRSDDDSFSRDFQHWVYLKDNVGSDQGPNSPPAAELEDFLQRKEKLKVDPIPRKFLSDQLQRIDDVKSLNLAFNVVFQKALFLAYLTLAKLGVDAFSQLNSEDVLDVEIDLDDLEEADGDAEVVTEDAPKGSASQTIRAQEFVSVMNRLFAQMPTFLDIDCLITDISGKPSYLWAGSLRKAGGTIDFTQAAAKRAQSLILLIAGMVMYDDSVDPNNKSDFDNFWADLLDSPNSAIKIMRAGLNSWSGETGGGGKRLSEAEKPYSETKAQDEGYSILKYVWSQLGL